MAFVNVEKHFPPIRPCRDFAQIFLEALSVAVGDYRVSDFRIICEFCYKIVKAKIDVVYIMNSTGSRTEPCGTPLVTGAQSEADPLITTLCFLLFSQFSIQLCTLPTIPSCLTLNMNLL